MSEHTGLQRPELAAAICHELYLLAKHEEDTAADQAARTPYWLAQPPSVLAHHAAARALHDAAYALESHLRQVAS